MNGPVQPLPDETEVEGEQGGDVEKRRPVNNDNWYAPSVPGDLDTRGGRFGRGGGRGHHGEYNPHPDDLELSRYETYVEQPTNSAGLISSAKELEQFLRIAMNNGMTEEARTQVMNEYLAESKRKAEIDHQSRSLEVEKKRKWMNFRMIIGSIFTALMVIFVIIFIGLFVYMAINKGLLSEGGFIDGLFTTIQEVLKIILTTN